MADLILPNAQSLKYNDMKCLQPWILNQLKQLSIKNPTLIQHHCIPPALHGKDVIGSAKTGSGKTLAFVIPILQKLSEDPYGIFCLVLTPTRELAFQIADQFIGLGTPISLRLTVIVGGLDKVDQGAKLNETPHVVVATPGRLADIIETSPEVSFKRVKFLVLDEADRLMDGRFDEQLKVIFKKLPEKRQTLLFSATITDRVQRMRDLAKSDVYVWQSESSQATVQQLTENYCLISPEARDATMVELLLKFKRTNPRGLCIIFTNTCKSAQILHLLLKELGVNSTCLHGMMRQKERLSSLAQFKSSRVNCLVATDLASRGLDIPMVELVLNHILPNLPKTYIHRVGRTARAGRPGSAISLVAPGDLRILVAVEGETRRKMSEIKADEKEVQKIIREVNITKRQLQIRLEQSDFDERKNVNKRKKLIRQGIDPNEERTKPSKLLKKEGTNPSKLKKKEGTKSSKLKKKEGTKPSKLIKKEGTKPSKFKKKKRN